MPGELGLNTVKVQKSPNSSPHEQEGLEGPAGCCSGGAAILLGAVGLWILWPAFSSSGVFVLGSLHIPTSLASLGIVALVAGLGFIVGGIIDSLADRKREARNPPKTVRPTSVQMPTTIVLQAPPLIRQPRDFRQRLRRTPANNDDFEHDPRSLKQIEEDNIRFAAKVKALQTTGLVADAPKFYPWAAQQQYDKRHRRRYPRSTD